MLLTSTLPTVVSSAGVSKKGWQRLFLEARPRLLAWYVVLMGTCIVVSLLLTRHMLINRSEQQISRYLVQEVESFRRIARARDGRLEEQLDAFFERNTFKANELVLAWVDGRVYRASAGGDLAEGSLRRVLSGAPARGRLEDPDDPRIFVTEPLERGTLVVTYAMATKIRELDETITVALEVSLAVLAIASVLAWMAAGRVLAPLRTLTDTARSIGETDLTRRIPIRGADEIAELALTFNEMLDRLQLAFASQRNFINDAGHELRTPITIIRGHLELMGDALEERRETLALVSDELDRMSRFVDDLLLLVRVEQPNFLNLETLEAAALTEELFAKARALAPRHWQLEVSGNGTFSGDRQRITQAVMNLAQNATQHTCHDGMITIGSASDGQAVRFWVRDTGEGIAPTDQTRIFERFARAANSRRRSEGAGLGLAIVQAIAEAHGGRVELTSCPGHGSTFTVVLPRTSAES
ncbi:MAG: HAMP domain-containing protein [Gemmatimonadaceae bacterium]|nr:HAMP domain-containing protein [Gloeobacterales cyanobacterium ES-bin-141]